MDKNEKQIKSNAWTLHYTFGCHITARKRFRPELYQVSDDSRYSMVVFIVDKLRLVQRRYKPMTLDNAYKPWWMSENQYQKMLTRLGLPF